ncbi:xanthine dehydrogenase accessory protein XdhC [Neorhizobium galegae]|nr:xanthine dehydrogenase accessory protein XdhC [Neorhizobium galegae]
MAIDNARAMLSGGGEAMMDIPLGPEIGQCCGGHTRLSFQPLTPELAETLEKRLRDEEDDRPAVTLFGSGHVGQGARKGIGSPALRGDRRRNPRRGAGRPAGRNGKTPDRDAGSLCRKDPACGAAIILTHDHALDFLIAQRALARTDLAYVGMIGSRTKRATFANWLKREGGGDDMLPRLVLPIGGTTVRDKRPAVIAALVAAELLETYAARQDQPSKRQVPTV